MSCTNYEVYILIICNVFVSTHPIVVVFFDGAAFVCDVDRRVTIVAKAKSYLNTQECWVFLER